MAPSRVACLQDAGIGCWASGSSRQRIVASGDEWVPVDGTVQEEQQPRYWGVGAPCPSTWAEHRLPSASVSPPGEVIRPPCVTRDPASGFLFQAEDGIRDHCVTGVQTCALPI